MTTVISYEETMSNGKNKTNNLFFVYKLGRKYPLEIFWKYYQVDV